MSYYLAEGTALSGNTFTEVTDANYVRQQINLSPFVYGRTGSLQGATFGPAATGFGTVAALAIFDKQAGGNMLLAWPRSKAVTIGAGKTHTFVPGDISFQLPDMAKPQISLSAVVYEPGAIVGTTSLGETMVAGVELRVSNGVITGQAAAETASQATLTDAATVAVDASTGAVFDVTLAGSRTLGFPSNLKAGMVLNFLITQGAGGSHTLAYAAGWKFAGGTPPTLSITAGAIDWLQAVYDGTVLVGNLVGKAFA